MNSNNQQYTSFLHETLNLVLSSDNKFNRAQYMINIFNILEKNSDFEFDVHLSSEQASVLSRIAGMDGESGELFKKVLSYPFITNANIERQEPGRLDILSILCKDSKDELIELVLERGIKVDMTNPVVFYFHGIDDSKISKDARVLHKLLGLFDLANNKETILNLLELILRLETNFERTKFLLRLGNIDVADFYKIKLPFDTRITLLDLAVSTRDRRTIEYALNKTTQYSLAMELIEAKLIKNKLIHTYDTVDLLEKYRDLFAQKTALHNNIRQPLEQPSNSSKIKI